MPEEPGIDEPPVWTVVIMPCCFAQPTIGAYLASLAGSHAPTTIRRRLSALGKMHRFNDLPWNPAHRDIQGPLQGVLRSHGGVECNREKGNTAAAVHLGRWWLESAVRLRSRGVAQPGSASALGAEGRQFESDRPDQYYSLGTNAMRGLRLAHLPFAATLM